MMRDTSNIRNRTLLTPPDTTESHTLLVDFRADVLSRKVEAAANNVGGWFPLHRLVFLVLGTVGPVDFTPIGTQVNDHFHILYTDQCKG